MTISQSRYGMNAEVGRNPSRPPVKDQRYPDAVLAGVGTAGAGTGVYLYGRQMPKRADTVLRRAEAGLGSAELNLERALKQKKAAAALKDELRTAGHRRDAARVRYDKVARNSKLVRRGGLGVAGAGLGLAALAAYMGERERGTLGYRRPTRAEFAAGRGR